MGAREAIQGLCSDMSGREREAYALRRNSDGAFATGHLQSGAFRYGTDDPTLAIQWPTSSDVLSAFGYHCNAVGRETAMHTICVVRVVPPAPQRVELVRAL